MAEMVGLSRSLPRHNGGFFAAIKVAVARLTLGRRATRLDFEQWPDYLLRDIGMDRSSVDVADPRTTRDWLHR